MTTDERALNLLDELREGRGRQKQINIELYRRVEAGEEDRGIIKKAVAAVNEKANAIANTVVARVSAILGVAIVTITLIQIFVK